MVRLTMHHLRQWPWYLLQIVLSVGFVWLVTDPLGMPEHARGAAVFGIGLALAATWLLSRLIDWLAMRRRLDHHGGADRSRDDTGRIGRKPRDITQHIGRPRIGKNLR